MDITVIVALVGSGIAALASITAALFSRASAKHARISAERVNGVNQRIAALDQDSQELRDAYKQVTLAWATSRGKAGAVALAADLEVLRACRASDDSLGVRAVEMADFVGRGTITGDSSGFDVVVTNLRTEYRRCQNKIADDRESFFTRTERDLDPWWSRFLLT